MDLIKSIESGFLKKDVPHFIVGDTVRVDVRIVEDDSERLQAFEGVIIARKGVGARETITVRKVSYGIGIERSFFIHSPMIGKLTVVKHGKVRRAKLYYLRERFGKSARIEERKPKLVQAAKV
ncbi:MAG: 50S ribosomal protein L19 [Candidatus Wallbacteria bacterium GWC2_49_35]|uniref:Large ribosomal subunit protein bL19 n=1 Tax=Candidatus Wallbacteria bacterium GWC2_49_35 TaxID=1817813 RepID=A0A1F7WM44_9BACT|nr:MAG: 50S ribosomal protein L19 [Candidatus Wallbacteria bacterium GWC2_49_35]HBC76976.1 50S ribosomal protein L19 [Candidatus Wallbacteria bacterium]